MQVRNETGTQRLIGYVVDIEGNEARVSLTVDQQHGNRHDVLHGGVISILMDVAMGIASSLTVSPDASAPFMTITITVQYHAPAHPGQVVTATGRVAHGGNALLFCQAELRADDGTLVATATGVFKRVKVV